MKLVSSITALGILLTSVIAHPADAHRNHNNSWIKGNARNHESFGFSRVTKAEVKRSCELYARPNSAVVHKHFWNYRDRGRTNLGDFRATINCTIYSRP